MNLETKQLPSLSISLLVRLSFLLPALGIYLIPELHMGILDTAPWASVARAVGITVGYCSLVFFSVRLFGQRLSSLPTSLLLRLLFYLPGLGLYCVPELQMRILDTAPWSAFSRAAGISTGFLSLALFGAGLSRLDRRQGGTVSSLVAPDVNPDTPKGPVGTGKYGVVELPDRFKRLFSELLLGFEEFAGLRGYAVNFSVDNSIPNRCAFKFTFAENNAAVSDQELNADLMDYLWRILNGESFGDLSNACLTPAQRLLCVSLQNRITVLQSSIDFYRATLQIVTDMRGKGWGAPVQPVYIHNGTGNQACDFSANNSPRAVVGQDNQSTVIDSDQRIYIANSPLGRRAQIEALAALDNLLTADRARYEGENREPFEHAALGIRNAKEEIESQQPDPKRISKWLETAKHGLKALALTVEVKEAATKLWDLFKLSFLS